jgi:magnesium transporter
MADPLFTPEAQLMLEKDDRSAMQTFCETLHPATVADALTDSFTPEEIWRFLRSTSISNQASIFAYFPLETQELLVEGSGREAMASLLEEMSSDDRADLMRRLPDAIRESLLRLVDEADRRDIARLIEYPENTAGALLTTDYAWLPANITVGEALERLRLQAPDTETIYYVYIVDEQRRLMGVVSLRELIMAPRRQLVSELMETHVVSVRDTDDREKVAQDFAEYDLLALPVVDADGRLVGIITSDDIVDVVVSEASEDAYRMGAIEPLEQEYLKTSFLQLWRSRAFWLSMLFLAELFTFSALSAFEDAIANVVVLSLFVPLCISTGGNSGSQAATLITRAMALGQITLADWRRVLGHEIAMGIVLGLTLGAIGFVRASATPESVRANSPPRREGFTVRLSANEKPLHIEEVRKPTWFGFGPEEVHTHVALPPYTHQEIIRDEVVRIELPENEPLPEPRLEKGMLVYEFPPRCTIRNPPVDRWQLAAVVALAVAAICLWGTLMGSMLPLIFKRFGIDPGIASSPFVATFVDVTGIIIYFSIAKAVLWDILR